MRSFVDHVESKGADVGRLLRRLPAVFQMDMLVSE